MTEELNKSKYKIPSETADKAFALMNLDDEFRLDYEKYREFYENLLKKLETQGTKNALTRDFRNMGEKMSRKISMSMRGAATRAGYRQLQDGTFNRALGKSWQEILKKKKKKKSPYANPKLRASVVQAAKNKVFGDGKGGNARGAWSGRKAQWAAREYKKRGGTYK